MKKIAFALFTMAALPLGIRAQEAPVVVEKEERIEQAERPERKERPEKKETQEIIIRQNGKEKDLKLKVEIDGEEITINGKPLAEFRDKNVTINKRKMIISDGSNSMQFSFGNGGFEGFGDAFGNDLFNGEADENESTNDAFLGVATEKAAKGVEIKEVTKGSAAEKAGLQAGDVITRVGNEKINSPEELADVIGFKKPNDEVKITYERSGKENKAKAVLGKKPARSRKSIFGAPGSDFRTFQFPAMPKTPSPDANHFNQDIMDIQQEALANAFPRQQKIGLKIQDVEEGGGVKVINVADSSAAAKAGIQKDDLITEINGKKIDNTDDAREELVPDEDTKQYKIKVKRSAKELSFDVRIPKKLKTANL